MRTGSRTSSASSCCLRRTTLPASRYRLNRGTHDLGILFDNVQRAVLDPVTPRGTTPPIHIPFLFEAAILSRMRSPVTSR
jgi:hypothetical protein